MFIAVNFIIGEKIGEKGKEVKFLYSLYIVFMPITILTLVNIIVHFVPILHISNSVILSLIFCH